MLTEKQVPNKKIRACIEAMIASAGPLAQTSWPRWSQQWEQRIASFKAKDSKNGRA